MYQYAISVTFECEDPLEDNDEELDVRHVTNKLHVDLARSFAGWGGRRLPQSESLIVETERSILRTKPKPEDGAPSPEIDMQEILKRFSEIMTGVVSGMSGLLRTFDERRKP